MALIKSIRSIVLSLLVLVACSSIALGSASHCEVSRLSAYDSTTGPVAVETSPLDHINAVKVPTLNESAWEGWYFDSASSSGKAGATIAFLRDPMFSIFGRGNLFVLFYAVWEDGTSCNLHEFVTEASIQNCDGEITGVWNSTDKSFSFHVTKDLQSGSFSINAPSINGTFAIQSRTSPRYADGSLFPDKNGPISLTPNDYWVEGISAGDVAVNLSINAKPLDYTGGGGYGRHYGAVRLDSIIKYWTFSRAYVGPYTFVFWRVVGKSSLDGAASVSGVLTRDGKVVVAATTDQENEQRPYLTFTPTHHGSVHGSYEDRSTGYRLDLVDPGKKKHWSFSIEHSRLAYEMGLMGGDGFGGFVNTVSGGLVGERPFHGTGTTQQNQMASEGLSSLFSLQTWSFIGESQQNSLEKSIDT